MGQGRPHIPQQEQRHRIVQGPWTKYLKYIDGDDPAKLPILNVFRDYELAGVEVTDESAAIAVKLGRQRHERNLEERAEHERRLAEEQQADEKFRKLLADHPKGIVYYIRRGDFVKIGTTTKYRSRMQALRPDEVLAVEPGSYTLEHQRHKEFGSNRFAPGSEYFLIDDRLKEHVVALRGKHGVPDQSVITVSDGRSILEAEAAFDVD
jgi:hypothetical protein